MKLRIGRNLTLTRPVIRALPGGVVLPIDFGAAKHVLTWPGGGVYAASGRPAPERPWQMSPSRAAADVLAGAETMPGPALFAGPLKRHFGHFIAESLARLWAVEELGDRVPLIFLGDGRPAFRPGSLATRFLSLFAIANPVLLADRPLRFPLLHSPTDLFAPLKGEGIHPRLRQFLMHRLGDPAPGPPRDLYISRSALSPDHGRTLGEGVIEQALAAEGYEIFHPQNHPLAAQIAAYRAARRVIAAESSALHLMSIFAPETARVAVIRRRPVRIAGMESLRRSFRTRDFAQVRAVTRLWLHDDDRAKPDFYALAELDFALLWSELARLGLIRWAHGMPVPGSAAMGEERAATYPDRTRRIDLAPGQAYLRD